MFFSKIIGFQRKSWIETHIKSHILVIMEQKSRASFEQWGPPEKTTGHFFPLFLVFDWFFIYIDKKQHEISQKSVFSDENWVQNDFSTISGSEDVNNFFSWSRDFFETYIALYGYIFRPNFSCKHITTKDKVFLHSHYTEYDLCQNTPKLGLVRKLIL